MRQHQAMESIYCLLATLMIFVLSPIVSGATVWRKCGITTRHGLESINLCASGKGDAIKFKPKYFKKIIFDKDGLAGVYVGGDCYWLNSKQLARKTFCFDNGPDYFVEDYARYVDSSGKFGFINRRLAVVISPRYDFVFPFENGKAKFCNGCKEFREPNQEHSTMKDGVWGAIDKKGNLTPEQ